MRRIEFQNSHAILTVSTSDNANWPLFTIPDGKSARCLVDLEGRLTNLAPERECQVQRLSVK
jgi:hypothetical protein